jgi:hypothetical protein
MTRVVIVARTRMRGDHVCIGGHDLDNHFRGVRLLDRFGDHFTQESPFAVGDVWSIRYLQKGSARPPHVEDAFVMEQCRMGPVTDLKAMVLKHVRPWTGGIHALFEGTVKPTPSGAAHIPVYARLPRCSTGYWVPSLDLVRPHADGRHFDLTEQGPFKHLTWVGVAAPPDRIEAGSLLRVSLSRAFKSETAPEGYYVQISGVL